MGILYGVMCVDGMIDSQYCWISPWEPWANIKIKTKQLIRLSTMKKLCENSFILIVFRPQ